MKEFNGSGLVIWWADGKMKYRMFSDQEQYRKEVERIKATTPSRAIAQFAINWDDDSLIALVGEPADD